MHRSTKLMLLVCAPLAGCNTPSKPAPTLTLTAALDGPAADDRRPLTGLRTAGEDITEEVKKQNAPANAPPLPRRHGGVGPTSLRPVVARTANGFVASIPNASRVPAPAHHRGHILAGGFGTHQIHAMNAETGKPAWSLELTDDGPTEPACKDGICVFNTFSCTLFSVDADTGRHLWSWYLGSPQLATPVIAGDIVYSSYPGPNQWMGGPFVIGAFDLKTGKPLWLRWIDAEVNSTPVTHGGRLYLATRAGTLYQFGAREGEVVSAIRGAVATPPIPTPEGVLFQRADLPADNELVAAAAPIFPDLEAKPARPSAVAPRPRPVIAQHRLVKVEGDRIVAVHRRTGERLWQMRIGADVPAGGDAPLLQAGDSLLYATMAGKVLRIQPDTGEVTATYQFVSDAVYSQPIAVDGWLYAGTANGALVAVDTGDASLTGWEMLGGGPERRGTLDPEGT